MNRMDYLLIPVDLCGFVLTNKLLPPFRLYILLKMRFGGKTRLGYEELVDLASTLNYETIKSVRNNLNLLINKNWVGHSADSGYYFIRGFNKVKKIESLPAKTGVEFLKRDFKNFKSFVAGAVFGYIVNQNKRKAQIHEPYRGGSKHWVCSSSATYYPLASTYISKVLNISESYSYKLKRLANKHNYIDIRKNYIKPGIPWNRKHEFKESFPEIANRIRCIDNQLALQQPDLVMPKLRYKKRR